MTKFARLAALAAATAIAATPAVAAPTASTPVAKARVAITKPLTLTFVQDLGLGTITVQNGSWSTTTVGITKAGVFSCGANVVCTGSRQVAKYNVAGTNNQVVTITAPNVTLVNQSNAAKTLTLTVDNPRTVTLNNSGNKGVDFDLGGSIVLSPSTLDGTYVGTFNVTVDY